MSVSFKTKDGSSVTIDADSIKEFKDSLLGDFFLPGEEGYKKSTFIW